MSPPELLKQFEEVLDKKPEVKIILSTVKCFYSCIHWSDSALDGLFCICDMLDVGD